MRQAYLAMLCAGALVAGCSNDEAHSGPTVPPGVSGPRSNLAVRRSPRLIGIQAAFVGLADSLPGFAGAFVGPDGLAHVAATRLADRAAIVERLRRDYAGRPEAASLSVVRLDTVRYDYRQLYNWKEALESDLGSTGPVGIGIHVSTNTVDVFSQNADVDMTTLEAAKAENIPSDAIRIIRSGSAEYLSNLTDQFAPAIPGGAGITLGLSGTNGCTLGINVKLTYNSPTWSGLTAAHCTATIGGGADATPVNQGGSWPAVSSGYRFGHEIADPDWSSSGCDGSYSYCRYADVAVIGYDATRVADSGYVAVTVKLDSMTTKWVSKDSTSKIAFGYWSDQPWEGVTLYHVGAKTGWHSGTVTESCSDWAVGEPTYNDREWECQPVVEGVAGHGDSGGPVFSAAPGNGFLFAGIVSRFGNDTAHYVFSSFANICLDLGGCPTVDW
jgi:hypothetical protein